MGYDLHITRAGFSSFSSEYPISRQEWQAAADAWPGMAVEGRVDYLDTGPVPVYALRGGGEHPASLYWRLGQINVRGYGADTGEIARLAATLGARLIGDEQEEYLADGTVVDSDAFERPHLLARPLYVNEVADAWRSMLDWEDCLDERPPAAQALRTFTALALREVATSDLPDADMLLYRCGTEMSFGERRFSVSMARQFAQPDVAGGDVVRVECELSYRPVPELLELRPFHQWAPSNGPEERRAWLSEIGDRPEWEVFDLYVPYEMTLCAQPIHNSRISAGRRGGTSR